MTPLIATTISSVDHILRHRPDRIKDLEVPRNSKNNRINDLIQLAQKHGISVTLSGRNKESENPVKATLAELQYVDLKQLEFGKGSCVLLLDHLQDPQNFGSICRTAEAFNISAVIIPKDRSVSITSAVVSASAGAVATLPIARVTNLSRSIEELKAQDFWIVSTGLKSEKSSPPWKMPTFDKVVFILGTEGKGVSPGIQKACDWNVEIPTQGMIDSLNVSQAATTLMYEWVRRIHTHTPT